MSRLLLVRHGETKGNSAERYWGRTDVELSDSGIRQGEQLRDRLAVEKIDTVYSSDLCRALKTADIITSRHQLAVVPCRELQEIDFGKVEGLAYEEIKYKYPELVKSWLKWDLNFRFPDGESIGDLSNRVASFIHRLRGHAQEDTILVVSHSGVLRMLICYTLGIELRHWRQIRLDLASLSILETYPEVDIINLLNDISHLR